MRTTHLRLLLGGALLLAAPVSCMGSGAPPAPTEVSADEATTNDPPATPQIIEVSALGLADEVTPPEEEPPAPTDPAAEPEEENPGGVNGDLPERPEEAGDDFTNLGDPAVPVPPEEQLLDAAIDEDNTLPAL